MSTKIDPRLDGLKSIHVLKNIVEGGYLPALTDEDLEFALSFLDEEIQKHKNTREAYDEEIRRRSADR